MKTLRGGLVHKLCYPAHSILCFFYSLSIVVQLLIYLVNLFYSYTIILLSFDALLDSYLSTNSDSISDFFFFFFVRNKVAHLDLWKMVLRFPFFFSELNTFAWGFRFLCIIDKSLFVAVVLRGYL